MQCSRAAATGTFLQLPRRTPVKRPMKFIHLILLIFLSCLCIQGKPGGTYVLTGQEKSIADILKADFQKYPELYADEPLPEYMAEFKRLNQIGKRKLVTGEKLIFPETIALRKALETEAEAAAELEAEAIKLADAYAAAITAKEDLKKQVRQDGIFEYQTRFLPYWVQRNGTQLLSGSTVGVPQELTRTAREVVDTAFAESLCLTFYPEKQLVVIEFEKPSKTGSCYFVGIRAEENGISLYSLEKGMSIFGTGSKSVLCITDKTRAREELGTRQYDDLDQFLAEFE